jgi:WD40 repeat protein
MADLNGGQGDKSGHLEALFAQFRQNNGNGNQNASAPNFLNQFASPTNSYYGQAPQQQQQPTYGQQPIGSPMGMPPGFNPHSRQSSSTMSPTNENAQMFGRPSATMGTGGTSNAERTQSLLNLLKFSQPTAASPVASNPPSFTHRASHDSPTAPSPSDRAASDLLASLMGVKKTEEPKPTVPSVPQEAFRKPEDEASGPPANTQAFLLQLLNRSKPAESAPMAKGEVVKPSASPNGLQSLPTDDASHRAPEPALAEKANVGQPENSQPASQPKKPLFTYVNPFDMLAASSPRNQTPKTATPARGSTPAATSPAPMQILKPPRHAATENADLKRSHESTASDSSPAHTRRKIASPAPTSTPSPLPDGRTKLEALIGIGASGKGKEKETVADAVSAVGDQVDKQVEEAIARVEAENHEADLRREEHEAEDSREAQEEQEALEHTREVIEHDVENMMNAKDDVEFELAAKIVALDIKTELAKEGNEHLLEEALPADVAEAVHQIVDDAAAANVVDSWDDSVSADGTAVELSKESAVTVYNFPLKPFVSITLKPTEQAPFRNDAFQDIARLKKDFDQIDRTLVAASNNFIVYPMKNGGIRIIRQSDGHDSKLFTDLVGEDLKNDRIFNVSLATSHSDASETMIGTGVSGTVYWAPACDPEGKPFVGGERDDAEKQGFALPPFKAVGEESSGGVVKTRARKSCGHPEFFAVGRGKSIHIIWPSVITKQGCLKPGSRRVVDIEKYLAHWSLKINTGKAGKDFAFSQDDSVVVSLDKVGRVKFWDVRTLTNTNRTQVRYPTPEQIQPVEINDPLMTLVTTVSNEKSWPTSVLLIDKMRPYQKGGALRYLVVGMKQNHTLQLWDLALGKQVQELHLPHEKDSDACCSVVYHQNTGMLVVGHPTRNSIYFIHVSSPRYNLPKSMTQADFIAKVAAEDPALPKPESTAVMSGIREYSFGKRGDLRSLDMIQTPTSADEQDLPLFELYCMHSKGVAFITIKQQDLGWSKDNRVINGVDGEAEGLVVAEVLKPIPAVDGEAVSATPASKKSVASSTPAKEATPRELLRKATPAQKEKKKEDHLTETPHAVVSSPVARASVPSEVTQQTPVNGATDLATSSAEKSDKKKKKKQQQQQARIAENRASQATFTSTPTNVETSTTLPSTADTSSLLKTQTPLAQVATQASNFLEFLKGASATGEMASDTGAPRRGLELTDISKHMQGNIVGEVESLLDRSLNDLYRKIDADKRAATAAADAQRSTMLHMVSDTLTNNVEKTLAEIVNTGLKTTVIPSISSVATVAVNDTLGAQLQAHLKTTLPRELQGILPDVLTRALQKPETLKLMSDSLAQSVSFRVEEQFTNILKTSITPAFTAMAAQAVKQATDEVQRQSKDVIGRMEHKRVQAESKIDTLSRVVAKLTEAVTTLSAAQAEFQGKILNMQQQHHQLLQQQQQQSVQLQAQASQQHGQQASFTSPASTGHATSRALVPVVDPVEAKIAQIRALIEAEQPEQAMIEWIKSEDLAQEVFEKYLAPTVSPAVVRGIHPLILLSVAKAVSEPLSGQFALQRLAWLEHSLHTLSSLLNSLVSLIIDRFAMDTIC